jgi:hypothetical protein
MFIEKNPYILVPVHDLPSARPSPAFLFKKDLDIYFSKRLGVISPYLSHIGLRFSLSI